MNIGHVEHIVKPELYLLHVLIIIVTARMVVVDTLPHNRGYRRMGAYYGDQGTSYRFGWPSANAIDKPARGPKRPYSMNSVPSVTIIASTPFALLGRGDRNTPTPLPSLF